MRGAAPGDDAEPLLSDNDGAESDALSATSEAPPDWNSDDEPPEDHIGDEQPCSRDGRVRKVIRRVGRGLERPGQYDIVRLRWAPLTASGEATAWAEAEELEINMGEDRLPLAVEFALKTMRIGEITEVSAPPAYGACASPLYGRRMRNRSGRLPHQRGKVPRKLRFLPAAPRGLAAKAKAEVQAGPSQSDPQGSPTEPSEQAVALFRAKVELLGLQTVHMLTEDRSVSKKVVRRGHGPHTPRVGDLVTFSVAHVGPEKEVRRYTLQLGEAEAPFVGLENVLLSMKEGEHCIATLPRESTCKEDVGRPAAEQPPEEATVPRLWRYDPPEERTLDLREAPELEAKRRDESLLPGDVFEAVEEKEGEQGVLFLRLPDGRGWVFDRKPGVGILCVRHEEQPACSEPPLQLAVRLHGWQRRDRVPLPPVGTLGFRHDAEEKADWPCLHKFETRAGDRLVHEIEEGSHVLVGFAPVGDTSSLEEGTARAGACLLSWCIGEGTVPGYVEAAVASMRMAESAVFRAPPGLPYGLELGPAFEGQTPLRRVTLPELDALLAALLDDGGQASQPSAQNGEVAGNLEDEPPSSLLPLPVCRLPTDWSSQGELTAWDAVGVRYCPEAGVAFRLALVAAAESPDVCAMSEVEQQHFLERERAHGNALTKLGRYPEAAAAYGRALDAVRRTPTYKALFPTERGRIQGAYSRDPGEDESPLERLTAEELQARRSGLIALHLNLALCASKQGRFAEARRQASTALGAEPDNPKALFRRGAAAAAHGDYEEALADFQRALELQPQDRAIREGLHHLQQRMRDHRQAEKNMFHNVFKPPARKEEDAPREGGGAAPVEAEGAATRPPGGEGGPAAGT